LKKKYPDFSHQAQLSKSNYYNLTESQTEEFISEITKQIKNDIQKNELKQLKSLELAEKLVTTSR